MRKLGLIIWLVLLSAAPAFAQSFSADVHFTSSAWSEFDGQDAGFGARFTWRPIALLGIDADFNWYPGDYPPDTVVSFSGSRVEGLFGATVGPKFGRLRPFVKAGAGFLDIGETPKVYICVTIFPPPLACLLAEGDTLPAYEIGGGVEIDATSNTFLRADFSDRILKYPGPSLRQSASDQVGDGGFFAGAFRFTIGGGFRF